MNRFFFLPILLIGGLALFTLPNAFAVTVYPNTLFSNANENLTAHVAFNVTSINVTSNHVYFNDRFFDFTSTHGVVPANITAFTENTSIRLHITKLNLQDVFLYIKGKVNTVQLDFQTRTYGNDWDYDQTTNTTTIRIANRIDVYASFNPLPTIASVTTAGTLASQVVTITPIATLSQPPWITIYNQTLYVNGSLYSTITYPPSVLVLGANTLSTQTVPGVLYATTFQSKILLGNATGGNVTITGNVLGLGSGPRPPDPPTLAAITEGPTEIRFITTAGSSPGTDPVKDYSLQCTVNNGIPLFKVVNSTLPAGRFFSYTGLSPGDSVACKWRDGSKDGWSAFSNEASAKAGQLAIVHNPRVAGSDALGKFIQWIDSYGGIYFGFSIIPLAVLLLGMLATPKTTGIFAIITLMAMGIIQGAGFYVYPNWYWGMMILLGIVVVLSRANEK